MLILIPVDSTDPKSSKITSVTSVFKWALVDFDEGVVKSIEFYDDRTQIKAEWIDFVVLKNSFENYIEFIEEGMMVLCIRQKDSIEEIIEAFKFKELDEV